MELFITILLVVAVVSGGIFIWTEIGITNDRLRWLEERLTKLEKDAVKITFTPKPNPKQFDGVKSEEPFVKTRTKRKPKTVKDWEDQFDLGGHE
jgi:DNA-binding Lrp family transcriptional regulator